MRKVLYLLILSFIGLNLKSQTYNVENGYTLPVKTPAGAPVRVLLVFAEIDYSAGSCTKNPPAGYSEPDPNNPGVNWLKGQLPKDADIYFDPFPSANPQEIISKWLYSASFGQYTVLGDYYDKIVTIPCSLATSNGVNEVINFLENETGINLNGVNTLVTKNNIPLNEFDYWTTYPNVAYGMPKTPNTNGNADGKIDYLQIIWRNHPDFLEKGCDWGYAPINGFALNSPLKNKTGFNNATSFIGCNGGAYRAAATEFAHALFGGTNWHDGGGAGSFTFMAGNHWYGLNGQYESVMMPMFNAWDRNHLGYNNAPDKNLLISARDNAGNEIATDLDLVNFPNTSADGTYILRDFVTTGDAIRIKLPHLDPAVKNQYLWIENHQMKHPIDINQYTYPDSPCRKNLSKGMYAYVQVGKDKKTSNVSANNLFDANPNELGGWIFPLSAEGNYDFIYRYDKKGGSACVAWGGLQIPTEARPELQNPFTGHNDLFQITNSNMKFDNATGTIITYPDDEKINPAQDKASLGISKLINGEAVQMLQNHGDDLDAFNTGISKNSKISIGTNPSSTPVYSYNLNDLDVNGKPKAYENRKIWLNGLSVEIIGENIDGNGAIKVKVRWDNYEVDRDTRWCGNIFLSPNDFTPVTYPLNDPTQYALNLLAGKKIIIDQGLSPTRDRNPLTYNDTKIFADKTEFNCLPGSYFHMEPNSSLEIYGGSTFKMQAGSKLEVHEGAKVVVTNGSKLIIEDGAELYIHKDGLLHIEPDGELIIKNTQAGKGLLLGNQASGVNTAEARVEGKLTINDGANLTYQGFGFYHFKAGHQLNLGIGSRISLTGTGKNNRMVKIGEDANLVVDGNDVKLANGLIECDKNSAFEISNAAIDIKDVSFIGNNKANSNGLKIVNPTTFTFFRNEFRELSKGLLLEDISSHINLVRPNFINCNVSIKGSNIYHLTVSIANILNTQEQAYGIKFSNSNLIQLINNNYTNCNNAVSIDKVEGFYMSGGKLQENNTGIYADNSLVFLRGGAQIEKNYTCGVEMYGTYDYANNRYTSMLTVGDVGCGSIANNFGKGVFGRDFILNIDAEMHAANAGNPANIKPNRFDNNGGLIFDICYSIPSKAPNIIYAKGNFWRKSPNNITGLPLSPTAYNIRGYCAKPKHYPVLIDASNFSTCVPINNCTDCPKESGGVAGKPFSQVKSCVYTGEKTVEEKFETANVQFIEEDHSSTRTLFKELATIKMEKSTGGEWISNSPYEKESKFTEICAHLIQVSQAISKNSEEGWKAPIYIQTSEINPIIATAENIQKSFISKIFPNPASGNLNIIIIENPAQFNIRIVNLLGQGVYSSLFTGQITIDVSSLKKGIYFIELKSTDGSMSSLNKVAIN